MWIGLLVIGCLAVSALGQDCGRRTEHSRAKRIVGGHYAGHWPWMATLRVAVRGRSKPFCGATVIGERWLLTAQHCIESWAARHAQSTIDHAVGNNTSNTQFTIAFATTYDIQAPKAEMIRRSKSVTTYSDFAAEHPRSYAAKVRGQDIAIIELDQPLLFSKDLQPICLRDKDKKFRYRNTSMKALGYGLVASLKKKRKYRFPKRLQELDVMVVRPEQCFWPMHHALEELSSKSPTIYGTMRGDTIPRLLRIVRRDMICAHHRGEVKGLCSGDSGGPLMKQAADGRWYLYGVAVLSNGNCGNPLGSSVFVDVTRQCEFIHETTRGEVDCVVALN